MSMDPVHRTASEVSAAAEAVDALLLGVEVMLLDVRRIMRETNVPGYLIDNDNELLKGIGVLLTLARHQALDIGRHGDTIQHARMAAPAGETAA